MHKNNQNRIDMGAQDGALTTFSLHIVALPEDDTPPPPEPHESPRKRTIKQKVQRYFQEQYPDFEVIDIRRNGAVRWTVLATRKNTVSEAIDIARNLNGVVIDIENKKGSI